MNILNRSNADNMSLKAVRKEAEKEILEYAMERSRYNQSRAASGLGLSRGSLRMKLKQHFGDKYMKASDNKVDEAIAEFIKVRNAIANRE